MAGKVRDINQLRCATACLLPNTSARCIATLQVPRSLHHSRQCILCKGLPSMGAFGLTDMRGKLAASWLPRLPAGSGCGRRGKRREMHARRGQVAHTAGPCTSTTNVAIVDSVSGTPTSSQHLPVPARRQHGGGPAGGASSTPRTGRARAGSSS